jgi:NADH:ubiquinone oxidoreductase subunit F (NADH-binding)/NADH:ubiquinone oxidoreductase subunit E
MDRHAGREGRAGRFPGPSLIPALNEIQRRVGWLPREELVALGRDVRRPLYEIEGLVSFYPHFRKDGPPPRVELAVCRDLSCWLQGGTERTAELRARYEGDPDVHLTEVSCLGRCDCAPAVAVNEQPAAAADAEELVEAARAGTLEQAEVLRPDRTWPTETSEPYAQFRRALAGELEPAEIVETLKASNLRGMGGAAFPTGLKWGIVADVDADPKYVICNADESEPGTFKDRQILAELPHLVLEGMLLGMVVVGAEQGWVFVRHEYGPETDVIRAEIERLREEGLLGSNVLGSGRSFDVEIFVSPGGYILGEETALIECMEGHRGEPRNKPPFPGTNGLWGQPTLMNSVETFADVPIILERGADWWKAQGTNGAEGWKYVAVSGHVENPGVYCVPLGTTVGELIALAGGVAGGRPLAAVQPGGASSNFLGPDALDIPLDFKAMADAGSMLGSGAVVVVAEGTSLLEAATNVLQFFRNESCGKCVPCRVGSHKALTILREHIAAGGGADTVDERIPELEETLRLTSICGLGQVALGPVLSVLRFEPTDTVPTK